MTQHNCPTSCSLISEPGRLTGIIETLARTSERLENVVAQLDRGASALDALHSLVIAIQVEAARAEVRITALESRVTTLEARTQRVSDTATFAHGSWKTLGVIGAILVAIAGAFNWAFEHLFKK